MNSLKQISDLNIQSSLPQTCGNPEIDSLFNKGKQLFKIKRYDKAAEIFRDILRKKPDHFAAIEKLGLIARELDDHEKSLIFFKALTEHAPLYPQGYGYCGAALMSLENYEEAIIYFNKVLTLARVLYAYAGLGNCYMYLGDEEKAAENFKKGVELQYDSPDVLYSYFYFYYKFTDPEDPHLKHIEDLARRERKRMDPIPLAALYTTLYKAYDDLGEHDKAMEYAALAGKTRLRTRQYDLNKNKIIYDAVKKYFDKDFFETTATSGLDSELPVFILAMPRSGTTLLEQILHSHKDVTGIGEDKHFARLIEASSYLPPHNGVPYVYRIKELHKLKSSMSLEEIGREHLAYLEAKANGAKRVVDKGIIHYSWVGMLYLAFPRAKFIHLTRDPLSSALSSYTRNFANNTHPYTNDLYDLGCTFRLHYEIMEHWKKVVPVRIYDLSYESLVEDTEGEARKLTDFIGLPWDENCLNFHRTKKVVKTASAQQVRKPIYKSSLKTWQKYEKHLAPLVEGLGPYAPEDSLYIIEKYGKNRGKKPAGANRA